MDLGEIHGFGRVLLLRLGERWPALLDDPRLRRNPYLMTQVRGVGFQKADRVALEAIGIARNSPYRIEAAAEYVLGEAEQAGHTAEPHWRFIEALERTVGARLPTPLNIPDDKVICIDGMWSRTRTMEAETYVADCVGDMLAQGPAGYDLLFSDEGLKQDQLAALQAIRRQRIALLTGSPGTGKTTLIRAIVSRHGHNEIALCAPSGKAAKRIEELTGLEAKTIHRTLEVAHPESREYRDLKAAFSPGFRFRRGAKTPLDARLVVVDESSMVDIRLLADLFTALRYDARLILVGDPFQLPSVGPGAALRDLIRAGVPHFELTTLKRQDPTMLIARNCSLIRREKRVVVDNTAATDFFFVARNDAAEIANMTVEYVTKRLPAKFGIVPTDIMTLVARRKQGHTSAESLNHGLRSVLNPGAGPGFAPGDRVIQLRNDYDRDIFNGETGTVLSVDKYSVTVRFDLPPRNVSIARSEMDLMFAYALTVHKAQGSEWPWCVIPLHSEAGDFVTSAQHLYTAISRARNGCLVIGQRRWLDHLAALHRDDKRSTRLAELLV